MYVCVGQLSHGKRQFINLDFSSFSKSYSNAIFAGGLELAHQILNLVLLHYTITVVDTPQVLASKMNVFFHVGGWGALLNCG